MSARHRRQSGQDVDGGRIEIGPQPGEPGQVGDRRARVGEERRATRLGVGPQQPRQLGDQDERDRVVGVHRGARGRGVDHPPARPSLLGGDEQCQGREHHQSHRKAVAPALRRVEDHERSERGQRGRHQRRRPADGADAHEVDERDRRRTREHGGQAQHLRGQVDARGEPREHEEQRRGDLGVGVHRRDHPPEPVGVENPVGGELVSEQALAGDRQPQNAAQDHEDDEDQHGGRPAGGRMLARRAGRPVPAWLEPIRRPVPHDPRKRAYGQHRIAASRPAGVGDPIDSRAVSATPDLRVNLENPLPASLPVGKAAAVFVHRNVLSPARGGRAGRDRRRRRSAATGPQPTACPGPTSSTCCIPSRSAGTAAHGHTTRPPRRIRRCGPTAVASGPPCRSSRMIVRGRSSSRCALGSRTARRKSLPWAAWRWWRQARRPAAPTSATAG